MFGHFFVHVQNPGHFGFVLPHMYLQALEIPEPLHGDLPLHLACKYFEGDRIDVDALAALANGYRDAVSTTNRDELTPRQMIQNGQHPDKEDIVRMLDSL